MDKISGLFHLLKNLVFLGVITHLLTIDPNFLGHPSRGNQDQSSQGLRGVLAQHHP